MNKKIDENQIIDVKELSKILDVSSRTVMRSIERKELPKGKKIGKKTVWLGRDLLRAMASLPNVKTGEIENLEVKKK